MPADRHGWNALDHYIGIHDAHLRRFDHLIESNSLEFRIAGPDSILISGRIEFPAGVFLDVHKILEINDRNQVRTLRYSYHAGLTQPTERSLFRYDNAHRYDRAGHADEHHKHVFDSTGEETENPVWIGRNNWPTLGDVLQDSKNGGWKPGDSSTVLHGDVSAVNCDDPPKCRRELARSVLIRRSTQPGDERITDTGLRTSGYGLQTTRRRSAGLDSP